MKKHLAIIIPAHNEATNIAAVVDEVSTASAALADWTVALWFVDDGSTDATVERIRATPGFGRWVGLVRLSRNFGHQGALEAGLMAVDGDAVIMMDADLQHPAEAIPGMVRAFEEGADVVQMARRSPAGGARGVGSYCFYRLFSRIADSEIVPNASDFRLISRRVCEVLRRIPEREKFLRGLIPQLGFRQALLEYDERPRRSGTPSYTFRRSLRLANKALFDFSGLPLRMVFWFGVSLAAGSFVTGLGHILYKILAWQDVAPGFTDLIVAVLFLSGCTLASLGVIGRYLHLVLEQVRGRPAYIVAETVPPSQGGGAGTGSL